jgi:hypothetical protein
MQASVPKGLVVAKHVGPDFDVFYVSTVKRQRILLAYVGYYPSFPRGLPAQVKVRSTKVNGYSAEDANWTDVEGGLCREVLVSTGRRDYARYMHFVYGGLTNTEAKLADGIMSTLRAGKSVEMPPAQ